MNSQFSSMRLERCKKMNLTRINKKIKAQQQNETIKNMKKIVKINESTFGNEANKGITKVVNRTKIKMKGQQRDEQHSFAIILD